VGDVTNTSPLCHRSTWSHHPRSRSVTGVQPLTRSTHTARGVALIRPPPRGASYSVRRAPCVDLHASQQLRIRLMSTIFSRRAGHANAPVVPVLIHSTLSTAVLCAV
jgi:hypothetical protein